MRSLAQCLPIFPGLAGSGTHAPWPVWSGSVAAEVKFQPMPKKAAIRIFHKARDFDRQTREPGSGHHGGAVGHAALQVLHALVFDFLNFGSGRLDPSYAAIACKANVCERTVANALQRLRSLGILTWLRRCREERGEDGAFRLRQETNAYAVLPPSQWPGYREPPAPPPPQPGTWGAPERVPSVIEAAARETDLRSKVAALSAAPALSGLEAALASLGRAMLGRKTP